MISSSSSATASVTFSSSSSHAKVSTEKVETNEREEETQVLFCDLCEFKSETNIGFKTHTGRKQKVIPQVERERIPEIKYNSWREKNRIHVARNYELYKDLLADIDESSLKVPWHEIFLFQNMLQINAFIKVAFLFFSSLVEKFGSNPKFPKYWSLKLGHGFPCCSKYL